MIVVNSSTRQFNIPGADLVFGVEADSGSEIKYFQCPRYVGNNLDLTGCFIRMNFRNANGEIDSKLIEEVTVDGDNIVFGWELSPKVTMYKGNVGFVMCVVGPDTKVAWHTTLGRGQVLEGLEPDSALVEEGTADVVAQLIAMVEAQTEAVEAEGEKQIRAVQDAAKTAETASVAEIEAKGVNTLESIPEDYTSLENTVDGLVRGRAGAIVCEVAGSAVAVNDASDMAIQGMRIFGKSTQDGVPTPEAPVEIVSVESPVVMVYGKNLIALEKADETRNGFIRKYHAEDGSITISGAATASVDTVVHLKDMTVHPFLEGGSTYSLKVYKDGVAVPFGIKQIFTDGDVTWGWKQVETRDRRVTQIYLQKTPTVGDTSLCGTYQIQLEVGAEATEYEPYKAPQTVSTTHTLPGIPVASGGNYTDSDGQQWICDEVDLERGVYVQRIKTDTVTISSRGVLDNGLSAGIYKAPDKLRLLAAGAICDRAKFVGISGSAKKPNCFYENLNNFGFTGAETDTLEMLQTAYDGATVAYILATPIETTLSETEIAAYRAMHSNYPNTTVLNDSGAHMVVKYAADTKLYIDNKIAALVGG